MSVPFEQHPEPSSLLASVRKRDSWMMFRVLHNRHRTVCRYETKSEFICFERPRLLCQLVDLREAGIEQNERMQRGARNLFCLGGTLGFSFGLGPSCLHSLPCKLRPLFWSQRCHAGFSTFPSA